MCCLRKHSQTHLFNGLGHHGLTQTWMWVLGQASWLFPDLAVQVSANSEASPKSSSCTSSCPCSVASSLSLSRAGGEVVAVLLTSHFGVFLQTLELNKPFHVFALLIQVSRDQPQVQTSISPPHCRQPGHAGALSFSSRFPLMKCWGKEVSEHSAMAGTGARSCSESASLRSVSSTALQRCLSPSLLP